MRRAWVLVALLAIGPLPVASAADAILPDRPNVVTFPAQEARFVRFAIAKSSSSQPCIDELEIYAPDSEKNLALAATGAKASASSCLPGYAIHQIPHLNDGRYGNSFSWIALAGTNEWAQIELPQVMRINRVMFSRDRDGRYRDRLPVAFEIQLSTDGQTWRTVKKVGASSVVATEAKLLLPNKAIVLDLSPTLAKYVRLAIAQTGNGSQPCVDELEVYGANLKTNLALASRGGKASASSCIEGYAIHKIEHLNDGKCGNAHSWIAANTKNEWAQVELPEPAQVRRVIFSRDRDGSYKDRMPTAFEVRLSLDGKQWTTVKRVAALENVPIDEPLAQESPKDWATRIAMDLSPAMKAEAGKLIERVRTREDVQPVLDLYRLDRRRLDTLKRLPLLFNPAALRRVVADLRSSYQEKYRTPQDFEDRLATYERKVPDLMVQLTKENLSQLKQAMATCEEISAFQRDTLLANPLLDFDEVLLLKRRTPGKPQDHTYWRWGQMYGMTVNWSCDFRPKNLPVAAWWDDEIVALSLTNKDHPLRAIFKPQPNHMIQHPELHFDADRMLFTMPGPEGAFQVFEMKIDGAGLRQITTDAGPDVDNGDACYLPDGRIVFNSTRGFQAVPCENGNSYVANLCLADADGGNTRMLTFDQESNWYPTVLNDGRVLYTRYEYANISHQFARLLFHMNPDGTGQMEYYGSNSYWPNSIFYARPIPDHPTMVVGVVCGHHGPNRTGRLVLFDPARGRRETSGAVQTIPGWGKPVERVVADALYGNDWPKFVHPWPLSDKYFLASARLHPEQTEYGLYLVDVFDNITEICRLPAHSLFEPIPLMKRKTPPVIRDRAQPGAKEATMFLINVYEGQGLRGAPKGLVKRLRLFTYNYVYRHSGKRGFGHLATPGVDGPWEPRYLLGTVPVRDDGSALFRVPANTPVSVQPIDDRGRALQQMRSWFTAMPGEIVSCVGCHEPQSSSPPNTYVSAFRGEPDRIEPWHGPPRGFDFEIEVQPVLDRYCAGCHDGSKPNRPDLSRKSEEEKLRINKEYHRATDSTITTIFTPSFIALHPYVRRAHSESNYAMQVAAEFHADTSPLVQMLEKGHHNVALDAEAWERLYTWIDLGAPDLGSWKYSEWGVPNDYYERRLEMLKRFAERTEDIEWLPPAPKTIPKFVKPPAELKPPQPPACSDWPFPPSEAEHRQEAVGLPTTLALEIGDSLKMDLVLVPPGEFLMGDPDGAQDERPPARVRIEKPFYMSRHEVTNAHFAALVDPDHNSGHVSWRSIDWRGEGYPMYKPEQPVVRISWQEAMEFCRALSEKTSRRIALPTEAQWEWACRAGSNGPLWYGGLDDDFSRCENLSGREAQGFAFKGKRKWYLRDDRFDDGQMVTAPVGSYNPNPWGLCDMAGNVCEWTRTTYRPYPYRSDDGRDEPSLDSDKVVRGGSWYDKPNRAQSAFRWKYPPWRKIHNVGFRVVVEVK
ncbi:MAG: SUMF1/EgtB/PvdO family nonheme iron enzyme [Planctomycetota bacterium]